MNWRLECQTCKRSKCLGYGTHMSCDNLECNYKPYKITCSNCTENPPREGSFASKLNKLIKENAFDKK